MAGRQETNISVGDLPPELEDRLGSPFSTGRQSNISNLSHDSEQYDIISHEWDPKLKSEVQKLTDKIDEVGENVNKRLNTMTEKIDNLLATVNGNVDRRLDDLSNKISQAITTSQQQMLGQFAELNLKISDACSNLESRVDGNSIALDHVSSDQLRATEQLLEEVDCVKGALKLIVQHLFRKKTVPALGPDESDSRLLLVDDVAVLNGENEPEVPLPSEVQLSGLQEERMVEPEDEIVSDEKIHEAAQVLPIPDVSTVSPRQPSTSHRAGVEHRKSAPPDTTTKQTPDVFLDSEEVLVRLMSLGHKLSQWQVQVLMEKFATTRKRRPIRLTEEEFEELCKTLAVPGNDEASSRSRDQNSNYMAIPKNDKVKDQAAVQRGQAAFSQWINICLGNDTDLKDILPLDPEGLTLFDKIKDGILLCKLINHSFPEIIDERAINKGQLLSKYRKFENLTLALNSAEAIGCNVISITANDIATGNKHLVLDLLWQIIRVGLLQGLNIQNSPSLATLVSADEKMEQLLVLSPEDLLLRWINYHLARAGTPRRCSNFTTDIRDSEVYNHLLRQIAPRSTELSFRKVLTEKDLAVRAELVLNEAEKLGCRIFVCAEDIVQGVERLNLAFAAYLFNRHPGLEAPNTLTKEELLTQVNVDSTTEEKSYISWINSMGTSPPVNRLYSDLTDGLVILHLLDIIQPGVVEWGRVSKKFSGMGDVYKKMQNCNYAVAVARQMGLSLGDICGDNLYRGDTKPTLAFIAQLMKAHNLSILTQLTDSGRPIEESEIVTWVNNKLSAGNKETSLKGFQDPTVANAKVLIDLVDTMKPGVVSYHNVRHSGTQEDNLANAKYAISVARKIGVRMYVLAEDIVQVKSKMVMTAFACLMAANLVPGDSATTSKRPLRKYTL